MSSSADAACPESVGMVDTALGAIVMGGGWGGGCWDTCVVRVGMVMVESEDTAVVVENEGRPKAPVVEYLANPEDVGGALAEAEFMFA